MTSNSRDSTDRPSRLKTNEFWDTFFSGLQTVCALVLTGIAIWGVTLRDPVYLRCLQLFWRFGE